MLDNLTAWTGLAAAGVALVNQLLVLARTATALYSGNHGRRNGARGLPAFPRSTRGKGVSTARRKG